MPRPKPRSSSTPARVDPRGSPGGSTRLVQAGDRLRARARRSRASSRSRTSRAGPRSSARAWTWSRTRPRISDSEWPRSHLRRSRWMISCPDRRPVTSGTRWRNSRSTPPSSAWLTAGTIASASPPDWSQPASRRAPTRAPAIALPSAAASLSISTRADAGRGGQARRARGSRGSARRGRSGSSRPATPGLGERPVGQPDHLGVGRGPAGAEQLDADLGELAEPVERAGRSRSGRPGPSCSPARAGAGRLGASA